MPLIRHLAPALLALCPACASLPDGIRWADDPTTAQDLEVAWDEYRPADGHGPSVLLVSMVHFAEPGFYRRVQGQLDAVDVVLMEGIGSRQGDTTPVQATGVNNSLRQIADLSDLVMQWDNLSPRPNWVGADLHESALGTTVLTAEAGMRGATEHLWRYASHAETLIAFDRPELDAAARKRKVSHAVMRRILARGLARLPQDAKAGADGELIARRNAHVLEVLDAERRRLPDDGRIAFCWGIRHLPGLAAGLRQRGYRRTQRTWQPVFRVAVL